MRGYFAAGGTPSDLVTSGGAVVHGGTVRILAGSPAFVQLAQAGGMPAGPAPIGKLRVVSGQVKVVHDGVEQDGTPDTDVYRNDVLVTGPGASVAVRFADGTHFALGQNARMTLDSFAFNSQSGYLITQTNFTAYSTSQFAQFPQPTLLVNLDKYQDALTAMQTSLRTLLPGETDTAEYNLSPLDQAPARIITGAGGADGGSPDGLNYQLVTFSDLGITLVVFQSNGQTFAAVFNTGEPPPPNAGGDTLTYSLVNDAGGRFAIDPATGVVTVASGASLPIAPGSYTITVQASDGSASSAAAFTIRVLDTPGEGLIADSKLDDRLKEQKVEARCALQVIDLKNGDAVHWLRLEGVVSELYDVAVLQGVRRPMALGFKSDEIRRVISVGEGPV
ncbi:MAG: DUF4915 domain-containing protein [Alphaproteobacteria bacterium]|nr:DUF4915 domain-containing protein [Alphaproteobacteria bacterium]